MTIRIALIAVGAAVVAFVAVALFERFSSRRILRAFQKRIGNPLFGWSAGFVPGWVMIETMGRRTGRPHRVPVGGGVRGGSVWVVASVGRKSDYVRNIEADPRVRVRVHGRWRTGTAYVNAGDDPRPRALRMNPLNGLFVILAGIELLTIRIDLEPRERLRTRDRARRP
jgi:deazaflavin-dependent oxidoreductase (nitroreductase family)